MTISTSSIAELFRNDFIVLAVTFDETYPHFNKQYFFKAPLGQDFSVGEQLVVQVQADSPTFKVVTIRRILRPEDVEFDAAINYKWIVGPLDTLLKQKRENEEKDARIRRAFALVEKRVQQQKLKSSLEAVLKELTEVEANEIRELLK